MSRTRVTKLDMETPGETGGYVFTADGDGGVTLSGVAGELLDIEKDDSAQVSDITILNFEGSAVQSVVDEGGGKATVSIIGGSGVGNITIHNDGALVASGVEVLDFTDFITASGSGTTAFITGGLRTHHCTVERTSTNSFVNDWTIVWTAAAEDDENMYNTDVSTTAVYSYWEGIAIVTAQVGFSSAGGTGDWAGRLYKSGTLMAAKTAHCSDWNVQNGHMLDSVAWTGPVSSGNYFQVSLGNYSGSGKTNSTLCSMEVTIVEQP